MERKLGELFSWERNVHRQKEAPEPQVSTNLESFIKAGKCCGAHIKTDGLLSDQEPSIKAFVGYTQIARKNSRAHTLVSVEFCVRQRTWSHSFSTPSMELNT